MTTSSILLLSLRLSVSSLRLRTVLQLPTRLQSEQHEKRQADQFTSILPHSPAKKRKHNAYILGPVEYIEEGETTFCFSTKPFCHPLTPQHKKAQTASKSVKSLFCMTSHRQKQHFTLTYFVQPTLFAVSHSTVPKAANGFSAIYLLTVKTEHIRSEKSVRSHHSTALYRQKQSLTVIDLVRRRSLFVSHSTVHTAADVFLPSTCAK